MNLEPSAIPFGHNSINPFVLVKDGAEAFLQFVATVFDGAERTEVRTPDRDGKLIHAEIRVGNSTLMVADSKDDWPFTPAFLQVHVRSCGEVLARASERKATIVTEPTSFYGGFVIARFQDPWGNLWWLYEPSGSGSAAYDKSDTSWHDRKPSYVYTTLVDAMAGLTNRS